MEDREEMKKSKNKIEEKCVTCTGPPPSSSSS